MEYKANTEGSPGFSVIIPTADRGALLHRSLDSVMRQTLGPLEILLVDNGREAVVADAANARVRVIRTAPRIGPSRARNTGARAAVGEYITFLDDDDLWQPDYLQRIAARFAETGADAVLGQLMRLNPDGSIRPYKLLPEDAHEQRRVFYSNPGFGGQNLSIRRDVFLAFGGFDETMPASEDRDLAARLLLAGKRLVPAPAAMAVLCDHEGARARHSQVRGNWMFIRKHWRRMRPYELYRACKVLAYRRFLLWQMRVQELRGAR